MATAVAEAPTKRAKTDDSYEHTREAFTEVYYKLRDQILNDPLLAGQPTAAREWVKEMLDYNVPGGKLNRGMAVYDVMVAIRGEQPLSSDEILKANVLGWCIEWLQAFFLVADDIMDGSITRRDQPCWYKQPHVGLIACNDYILLECCLYRLLKFYFAGDASYVRILEMFLESTYQTAHGQLLDLTTAPPGTSDLNRYTMDAYMGIVTYKTAYYTIYLPVACGLVLAGVTDEAAYKLAKDICVQIGQYFQIQDDYLDCFGDPAVIGKIGTDIEDNKCCWMVCTALQIASDEQKEVIKANYGKHDPAAVSTIKDLYHSLGLEQRFHDYEAASYATLSARIEEQQLLPKAVFTSLLSKIYKRKK